MRRLITLLAFVAAGLIVLQGVHTSAATGAPFPPRPPKGPTLKKPGAKKSIQRPAQKKRPRPHAKAGRAELGLVITEDYNEAPDPRYPGLSVSSTYDYPSGCDRAWSQAAWGSYYACYWDRFSSGAHFGRITHFYYWDGFCARFWIYSVDSYWDDRGPDWYTPSQQVCH